MKAWPYPKLFAHRGGGSLAPENTLAAFRIGQSLGYRAHEFDVKLSGDGVAMLLHDTTLKRTTNGRGRAADHEWARLLELDAGSWHSKEFAGERIPSFEDAAQLLVHHGDMANVEIKPTPGVEHETGLAVAALAAQLWAGAHVAPLLSSFSFASLMAARESAPELPRGWLVDEFDEREDWRRLEQLGAVSLHTNHRKIGAALIERLHAKGYRVLLYTVNDVARAKQLFAAGADALVTDNLREFASAFDASYRGT